MRTTLLVLALLLSVFSVWQFLKVIEVVQKGPPEGVGGLLVSILILLIVLKQQKDRPA